MNIKREDIDEELFDGIEWRLIAGYIAGEANAEERHKVEKWMSENPERREEFLKLQSIYIAKSVKKPLPIKEEAWNYVVNAIEQGESDKKQAIVHRGRTIKYIFRAAAIIVFIIGGYVVFNELGGLEKGNTEETAWNEKSTVPGEKVVITLKDNSVVTLNAGSKIKYPSHFNAGTREVYLEGEAFFEVQHDSSRPFIVHTSGLTTTVLGTKFDVNAFPKEKNIVVSLVEGSVKVAKENRGKTEGIVVLRPNQQVTYNKENEISSFDEFDPAEITGWQNNILIFRKEPFSSVLVKLERAFGIKFELTDKSFNSKKITANFKKETIWTISETLKRLTGLEYKTVKENNETKKIIFYKK